MSGILGFESLDIVISNREFLDWYNNIHNADNPRDINDFEYPYNGEWVPDLIESFIQYRFNLKGFEVSVILKERDNVEFPQRVRFLAKCMVQFNSEKDFNLYKISEPTNYSELLKISKNPILVNPDYGMY